MADRAPTPDRQLAMVFDLNKCLGCQTCTVACKTLWTDQPGMEHMWWNVVNTVPGAGSPRHWMELAGGFGEDEKPRPSVLPTTRTLVSIGNLRTAWVSLSENGSPAD